MSQQLSQTCPSTTLMLALQCSEMLQSCTQTSIPIWPWHWPKNIGTLAQNNPQCHSKTVLKQSQNTIQTAQIPNTVSIMPYCKTNSTQTSSNPAKDLLYNCPNIIPTLAQQWPNGFPNCHPTNAPNACLNLLYYSSQFRTKCHIGSPKLSSSKTSQSFTNVLFILPSNCPSATLSVLFPITSPHCVQRFSNSTSNWPNATVKVSRTFSQTPNSSNSTPRLLPQLSPNCSSFPNYPYQTWYPWEVVAQWLSL